MSAVTSLSFADILKQGLLFAALSPEQLSRIGSLATMAEFPAGAVIFRRDEPGDAFYLIASGQVRVFVTNEEGAEVELARLGPGESFGEMALLTGEPRSASVAAAEPVQVLVLLKSEFDRVLAEVPELARHFIGLLGRRLRQGNVEAERRSSREQALRELMAEPTQREPAQLVGKSRPAKEAGEQAERVAGADGPAIVMGEPGTEKELVAQWVHEHSARASQVFLSVDCARIPPLAPQGQEQTQGSPLTELSQESALFGHRRGAFSFAKVNRLGYLEVASGGTLFLDNVDRLGRGVQAKLCEYLSSGRLRALGSFEDVAPSVRLILGCPDPAQAEAAGRLDPGLRAAVSAQQISIAPLRERRRDLAVWVDRFIRKYNPIAGKQVQGITPDALNVIYAYQWPRNVEELDEVVRRAVSLADGPQLTAEYVFTGVGDLQQGGVNLLRVPAIRQALESGTYPAVFQLVSVVFMFVMLAAILWGPRHSAGNVALVLAWAMWWPLLILAAPFGARFFCTTCPMGASAAFVQRHWTLGRKVPSVMKKYGLYMAAFGFVLIIWTEHVTGMRGYPLATAYLLLTILSCAVATALVFERAAWCRYLCPLGRMVGVYATLSAVSLRSNGHVCGSGCTTHSCYTGNERARGCPFYQGAFSLQTNEFCKLCANCVKACPNRSVRLYLRVPGRELWTVAKYSFDMAVLIPFFVATVLAIRFSQTAVYEKWLAPLGTESVAFSVALAGVSLGVWLVVYVMGDLWRRPASGSRIEGMSWVAYSILPLAFAGELGHQMAYLLQGAGRLLPVLGQQTGLFNGDGLGWVAPTGLVRFVQTVCILAGAWAAVYVSRRILQRYGIPLRGPVRLSRYVLVALLLAAYLTVFFYGA